VSTAKTRIRTLRRPAIAALGLVLLGLRVLELHAGLAPTWHNLAQLMLAIGMWSVLVAWFRLERNVAEPAGQPQPVSTQPRTLGRR
jgi:hypothetical protein